MKGKLELIRITEATEHDRKVFMNLEREFAELDKKYPYERGSHENI